FVGGGGWANAGRRPGRPLGQSRDGNGGGRAVALRLVEQRGNVAQLLREPVAGRHGARQVGAAAREPFAELAARRHFASDLCLELRLALGRGPSLGRGLPFGIPECSIGIGQSELDGLQGRGRFVQRGAELGLALCESFDGNNLGRAVAPRLVEQGYGLAQFLRDGLASVSGVRELFVVSCL